MVLTAGYIRNLTMVDSYNCTLTRKTLFGLLCISVKVSALLSCTTQAGLTVIGNTSDTRCHFMSSLPNPLLCEPIDGGNPLSASESAAQESATTNKQPPKSNGNNGVFNYALWKAPYK